MRELATDTGFHVAHAYEHCQHEFEVRKDRVKYGEGEKLKAEVGAKLRTKK